MLKEIREWKVLSSLKKSLYRFLNSKIVVGFSFVLLLSMLVFPPSSVVSADDGNENGIGVAYQHYLLLDPTKVKEAKEDSKDVEILGVALGALGSGGVSGDFSYDDIVSKANDNEKEQAKNFSVMMATYSTFNYITTQPEGFSAILNIVGRPLMGVLLVVFGLIEDIRVVMIKIVPTILLKINVIPMIANIYTSSGKGSELQQALGVSNETMKAFVTAAFSFATASLLISVIFMLKRGTSNVDQHHFDKFKGKIATLLLLPLFVIFSSYLFVELPQVVGKDKSEASFSEYLIDVDSWAKTYNFNPTGGGSGSLSMNKPNKGYVDTTYNPYTKKGRERATTINKASPLINNTPFPNASLAFSYLMSTKFNAQSFIDYKGTKESRNTAGSFYDYAINNKDKLKDVDNGYTGSLTGVSSTVSPTGYKKAIDDYTNDDDEIDNPVRAWKERFIYGVKGSGNLLEEYYSESPSTEQAKTSVGGGANNYSLSDQSMFLVLSTTFNDTGGYYLLDAPARGILAMKNTFDSSRSKYYSTSMTGYSGFTLLALLTKPLVGLVAVLTMLSVVSVAIIDMNVKPARAWLMGLLHGGFEYPQAFVIYALGAVGTVVSIMYLPDVFISLIMFTSGLIVSAISTVFNAPEEGLAAASVIIASGISVMVGALLSVYITFKYFKDKSFSKRLTEFFSLIWAWASETGARLEEQAAPSSNRISRKASEMGERELVGRLSDKQEDIGRRGKELADAYDSDGLKGVAKRVFNVNRNYDATDSDRKNSNERREMKLRKKSDPAADRVEDKLVDLRASTQGNSEINADIERATNRFSDYKLDPSEKNYNDGMNQLEHTRQTMVRNGVDSGSLNKIDNLIDEYRDLRKADMNVNSPTNNLNNFIPDSNKTLNSEGKLINGKNQPITNKEQVPRMLSDELEKRKLKIDDEGQLRNEKGIAVNNLGKPINGQEQKQIKNYSRDSIPQTIEQRQKTRIAEQEKVSLKNTDTRRNTITKQENSVKKNISEKNLRNEMNEKITTKTKNSVENTTQKNINVKHKNIDTILREERQKTQQKKQLTKDVIERHRKK